VILLSTLFYINSRTERCAGDSDYYSDINFRNWRAPNLYSLGTACGSPATDRIRDRHTLTHSHTYQFCLLVDLGFLLPTPFYIFGPSGAHQIHNREISKPKHLFRSKEFCRTLTHLGEPRGTSSTYIEADIYFEQ
jgi:hypothetical protein